MISPRYIFRPEANPSTALIGIITITAAVTLILASKSVLPLQIDEMTSKITAPIKNPV